MSIMKLGTIQEERQSIENQNQTKIPLIMDENEQFIPEIDQQPSYQDLEEEQQPKTVQNNEKTFVVSTGLQGFFIDDAFGFDPKQQSKQRQHTKRLTINQRITRVFGTHGLTEEEDDDQQLFEHIPQVVAWGIVFYAAFNNAMMPPWIMNIPAEKYLRIAWRFLLQGIFLIPFVMYEYRTGSDKTKQAYTYKYITNWNNMRKLYLASLSTSITFGVFLFCFDYTNISSVFVLGSQTNFWLSVLRNKQNSHDIENGGRMMCVIGFLLIVLDSFLLDPSSLPVAAYDYINPLLYHRLTWMRIVIGNCIPFLASLVLAELSKAHSDLRQIFPTYLSNMIVAFFVTLNMVTISYFMDGTSINFDSRWGWFGLFHHGKFMGFFYMSTMLSLGVFISSILISKLFEPIVPATASLFEPVITSILCQVAHVQFFPGAIACFGYVFLMPGQFIIIVGQHMLKKQQEQEQKTQQEKQQQQQQQQLNAKGSMIADLKTSKH